MKELSIEEKARRYDGAIKRLENIETGNCQKTFMFTEGLFDYIFPELKESEDERIIGIIRSTLESYNRGIIFDSLNTKDYADCLAWLEKQAQKPAELGENRSKELSLSLQIQAYLNTASDELYAKGKPLYSEKRIEDIHKCMLMWQKLHNAYFYHNLVEWSEEDKRKIDRIYSILRQASDTHAFSTSCRLIGDKECIELQDFLKSLRPQNTWKPSDEQMHYLSWIANVKLGDSVVEQEVSKHLNELYEDLLKLKS